MSTNKETILYLGSNGFPNGFAQIQRQIQLSKVLLAGDKDVLVVNRFGVNIKNGNNNALKFKGVFEGIKYVYASFSPYYKKNFLIRNLLKIIGLLHEFFILVYFFLFTRTKSIFVNTTSIYQLKYYWFICKIFRVNLIYDYVEYIYSIFKRDLKSIPENTNTFDTAFVKYCDKIIVISKFLESNVKKNDSTKKTLLIPPIINFNYFANKPETLNFDYFLFCGSAGYFDAIDFIIKAYKKSNSVEHKVKLMLIVNGSAKQINMIKELVISFELSEFVLLLSDLKYEQLISYYKNAKALLIPLQDNLQDLARFPFKISEYTASKRPIISTNSGSVADFFEDKKNALLANLNDLNSYSDKLNFVINNPTESNQIGIGGYELGFKLFNFEMYTGRLKQLIEE